MKNYVKLLFTALAVLSLQLAVLAQKPNFTGTWILNFNKSTLEHKPQGLTNTIFIINQNEDVFRLTRYHIFGERKNKISFAMHADGKTRKVKIFFKGKLEWKENDLLSTLWRKNFFNQVNYKLGIDNNELIADEVFKGRPQDHHNIWVFNRESSK